MFQTLPGFREFYPEDCARKGAIFSAWRKTARAFGFSEFEPPVLEPLELFTEKSGDEIKSQLFEFVDKGGRSVALRPEMTPSLARMVGAKAGALRKPVKWFCIGENYRYERQQKGRLRAFYQFNADILGEESIAADAEIIALLIEALRVFGLGKDEFKLRLGDRNLWVLFFEGLGIPDDLVIKTLSVVDKIEKVKPEVFADMMKEALKDSGSDFQKIADACRSFVLIKSLDAISREFAALNVSAGFKARVEARLNEWTGLLALLENVGVKDFISVDMGIVRGLAYYTGFVFEAFQTVGTGRALAGGGRYDSLVKKLGYPDMSAVGFGMGDVTVGDLLDLVGKSPKEDNAPDVYAVIGSESLRPKALEIVFALRRAGISADYPFKAANFGKQFKAADAIGVKFAMIFGEEEDAKGGVKMKNLLLGQESFVPYGEISKFLCGEKK